MDAAPAQSPVESPSPSTETSPGFVHLHLHTEYSLLDGGNKITPLLQRVKELGMNAVAVTDHGNLHGAVEFYTKAQAVGIKPIMGIEAYVAPGDRRDRQKTNLKDGGFHLVLLAENQTGWRNLLKLSTDSFINGFYYKPRMDRETLEQWSDGLIAINGHLGSSLAWHLLNYAQSKDDSHWQEAVAEAQWHKNTFGTNDRGEPRFFIELQRVGIENQELINPYLIRLAKELDLSLVCDNDAHFLLREDHDDHDTLCCISMGRLKDEVERLHYPPELYVKSPQEMADKFSRDLPEALANTVRIAKRCHVELDFEANHAPIVRVVKNATEVQPDDDGDYSTDWFNRFCAQYELLPFDQECDEHITAAQLKDDCDRALRELCEAGLLWRYGQDGITQEIRARLDRELQILADKLISAYFLIVWDFVNWARQRDIPAMARGSGVGTMVGYVLGLSNACPEEYGLLFERFTDPDRSEYPDIDIDICQNGRADVINYVREKYGHVAQIITFGRLKARAAIKDVSRVMGLTPGEGQRLANLVPNELNITLDAALEKEPDFRREYENDPQVRKIINAARALEHHARHAGVHAAGVVVATQPLDNIVPLCKATGGDDIITQWDGPTCERVGLLKMDFLGLRTLSTLERAKELVRETLPDIAENDATSGELTLDLDRITLDDANVFELFQRGDTSGVFQFESGGMRKLLVEMQPDRLEDLIAANALFRPGPMDLIPDYCQRKHGRQRVPTVHDIVDKLTAETYGIMVYQEQVMQIVHELGGIPLRAAYTLIKAISKKKHETIASNKELFLAGAQKHGLSQVEAENLFELILKFAGYGFNKSHSTGYAIVAYQTAYLKTYFPCQYMAAVLTYESAARKVEDWVPYLEDCRRTRFPDHTQDSPHVGVEVRPPDINSSDVDFTVVFDEDEPRDNLHGHIRFGLKAIKNVGRSAIASIVSERNENGAFESIFDFCERVDLRSVNKATIESLVKAGAFDTLHGDSQRAAVLAAVEDAIKAGQQAAEDRRSGQMNIFASMAETAEEAAAPPRGLPALKPWDEAQKLAYEKEVLGIHISGHPLDEHELAMRDLGAQAINTLHDLPDRTPVKLGGILTRVRPTIVRNGRSAGRKMAMITIQDKTGSIDGVLFSETYEKLGELLALDKIVVLIGQVDRSRAEPNVIVNDVIPLDSANERLAGQVIVMITDDHNDADHKLDQLHELLQTARHQPGQAQNGRPAQLLISLHTQGHRVLIKPRDFRVCADNGIVAQIRELLGEQSVRIVADHAREFVPKDDPQAKFRRPRPQPAGV